MTLTNLCLRDERPLNSGVQRNYALPNGYELSLINNPDAHIFPYAWEGAVINPDNRLDYDTPLTNDVEVFHTEEQAEAWIIRAIEWAVTEMTKWETGIASTPDPFHPAYGLPNDTRLRAVRLAETSGVKAAAKELNLAPTTLYRWRNAYASGANIK